MEHSIFNRMVLCIGLHTKKYHKATQIDMGYDHSVGNVWSKFGKEYTSWYVQFTFLTCVT